MLFYLASSSEFPRAFRLRLLATCFAATHVPLIAWLGWSAATGRLALAEFVLLWLATLAGTAVALLGIGALLAPIPEREASAAPAQSEDVIGSLLGSVNLAASAAEARMRELAAKEDLLTGARNRRGFLADVDDLLPAERRGAIALIDLDRFRQINDHLGHDAGDRVLRDFAARLSSELRRGDLVARWGGEEFALLFRGATEEEAARVLERVTRRLVANPLAEFDGQVLTFSAGVCRFGGDAVEEAIARAEAALRGAKQAGRNRVVRAGLAEQPSLPLA